MDLKILKDTPPWDWPDDMAETLVDILRNSQASEQDRVLATEMAGDSTVVSDELVDALLCVLQNNHESETVRARAATSLGPALDQADTDGFDDTGAAPISEKVFHQIQDALRKLYRDAEIPEEVRRRILEASVRAPQDWHPDAIRAAYSSSNERWQLTAVFCMRFVRGFDEQICEALENENRDIHCEAVLAAGDWGIAAAWPHVLALITSDQTPKPLLLAAIEAVPSIRPEKAAELLIDFTDSDDEDIVDAAHEALAMAEGPSSEDDDEDDVFVP